MKGLWKLWKYLCYLLVNYSGLVQYMTGAVLKLYFNGLRSTGKAHDRAAASATRSRWSYFPGASEVEVFPLECW